MSNLSSQYYQTLTEAFEKINAQFDGSISQAADLLVEAYERDELVHVIGTGGHSTIGALELFWRAGGIAHINPILDASLSPFNGALHSNWMERAEGLAPHILNAYEVKAGEVLIIVNAYGINPVTIDSALFAKELGMKTIGITGTNFPNSVPKGGKMRHSSGKNLHEIVDVFVDCHLPLGDSVVDIPGFSQKIGPSSTILNSYTLNLIVVATVDKMVKKGIEPPVWMSANLPEGDANNKKWHAKYNERVRHLR